jgi:hypothetical protein
VKARELTQERYRELKRLGTNFVEYAYLDIKDLQVLNQKGICAAGC